MNKAKQERINKLAQEGIIVAKGEMKPLQGYIATAYKLSLASGAKATSTELRLVALELAKTSVRLSLAEIALGGEKD